MVIHGPGTYTVLFVGYIYKKYVLIDVGFIARKTYFSFCLALHNAMGQNLYKVTLCCLHIFFLKIQF